MQTIYFIKLQLSKLFYRYDVHVRFHTGETPFKCPVCNKGFRDSKKMKVHISRCHKDKQLKCQLCPEVLDSAKAFEKHLLGAHSSATQLHVSTTGWLICLMITFQMYVVEFLNKMKFICPLEQIANFKPVGK